MYGKIILKSWMIHSWENDDFGTIAYKGWLAQERTLTQINERECDDSNEMTTHTQVSDTL